MAILTPIDEAVVILLVCLGAISFFLEVNSGNPFRPAGAVIVQGDFTKRADSRVEEFLSGLSVVQLVKCVSHQVP